LKFAARLIGLVSGIIVFVTTCQSVGSSARTTGTVVANSSVSLDLVYIPRNSSACLPDSLPLAELAALVIKLNIAGVINRTSKWLTWFVEGMSELMATPLKSLVL
jgi:hypothetical protein